MENVFDLLGKEMNEQTFAGWQKIAHGFHPLLEEYSFGDKEELDSFVKDFTEHRDLSINNIIDYIFALIFGIFSCKIDLNEALSTTNWLFDEIEKIKMNINEDLENKKFAWLHILNAKIQILYGTIYAYMGEYINSSYHFIKGLKSESITLNRHYCEFIQYVLSKLDDWVEETAEYKGCGFSKDNPMGSCGGTILISQYANEIISNMEGDNGEIIVAKVGRFGFFGHLVRLGSCGSVKMENGNDNIIDLYETYIIDSEYNLKKVKFYFNGYFEYFQSCAQHYERAIRLADGFHLKSPNNIGTIFKIKK